MPDVYDTDKRSDVMRRIRSKQNKSTELRLIQYFKEWGITGWRRNYKVKGHPDFVFIKQRVAVFVDGCFWHGHDCRNTIPKQNADFWSRKREKNIKHDNEITDLFAKRGWTVVRIWECELKRKNIAKLEEKLGSAGLKHIKTGDIEEVKP